MVRKMNRKKWLKLAIILGFLDIYFGSFISIFNIIFAFFNTINGFPHPLYLLVGCFMFWIVEIVFNLTLDAVEKLTILKIKECEEIRQNLED